MQFISSFLVFLLVPLIRRLCSTASKDGDAARSILSSSKRFLTPQAGVKERLLVLRAMADARFNDMKGLLARFQ